MKKMWLSLLFCFNILFIHAQIKRPNTKFGDVQINDLSIKNYDIDKNAHAVVLFDKCEVNYEGNNSGFFSVVYKYHKRIHILSKNAFDLATMQIIVDKRGVEDDKIDKLQAVTYNLEGNTIKTAKIDKSSIFKDKVGKYRSIHKFTLPEVKEGSIIEVSYTIVSPTPGSIRTWYFQNKHPILWSEYYVHIPYIYEFIKEKQGNVNLIIDSSAKSMEHYTILLPGSTATERAEVYSGNIATYHHKWAAQNIPAFITEPYTTTVENHILKLNFQLAGTRNVEGNSFKPYVGNWLTVAKDLYNNEYFGAELKKENSWLKDEVNKICGTENAMLSKAKKVYEWVRDNFICNNHDDFTMDVTSLKKVFQQKKGNVAEINLLLTAMLRELNIDTKPIILSTRDNGKAPEVFPLLYKFNYTICYANINNEGYLLDASHSKLGFGKLHAQCYNGNARVIDEHNPFLINLSADSINENSLTTVYIVNNENEGMEAIITKKMGEFESFRFRENFNENKKTEYFNNIKRSYSFDVDLVQSDIENLKNFEEKVTIKYTLKYTADEDMIYFSPMLTEVLKENPFKSAERIYPVEMPYAFNETYILNMEIPKGYVIDELPKSTRIKFNDTEGMFEYIIAKTANGIQFKTVLKFNIANFSPDDYATLRDFYAFVVKKQSEQIVFKKAK